MTCSPRAVHEAENVVAQADSLWRAGQMYGREAGDSTTLAQAYETLNTKLSSLSPQLSTTFAHSCYHYGRLLRAKDNPVEAMQVFIEATHSRTRDYHILGRVYSNIGSICHLAGEFPLSYDMYERSANCFLTDNDSLSYYFLLNDMAYELAEQGKKDSAFMVLEQIDRTKIDSYAIMKIFETKAEACLYAHMYDSAIYYTSPLLSYSYVEPEWLLIRAQAYSLNGENDSAVYYANRALSITNEIYHQNNALYILTNNDTTKDIEAVRVVAADRADVQKLIEIKRSKCAQAVQLLEQDLHRKPPRRWVYTLIAIILTLCSACIMYFTHRKHKLLLQQHSDYSQKRKADLEISCAALRNSYNLKKEMNWDKYDSMCSIVNVRLGGIAEKLKTFPDITPNDVRLCVLVLLELTYEDTALMLNLSSKSIAKLKSITAHKLGTTMKNLHDKLIQIACSDKEK